MEAFKITDDDPARNRGQSALMQNGVNIPHGLLFRCELCTIGLCDRLFQILTYAFLLDQNSGCRDKAINEAGVVDVNLILKLNIFRNMLHTIYFAEQREPELLTFALFISFTLPVF